jgi:ATP-dependent exoDNAse (exonuclease V) beta subunit
LRSVHEPDPHRPLHERTLSLARAALEADTAKRWNLLAQPARLRVQTIDALNLALARRLPVLSGLGAGLDVEEDVEDLYRVAAGRLLEHLPRGAPADSSAVATLLGHVDNRVDRFVDLVIEMLMRREAWLPVLPDHAPDPREEAELRRGLESARERLVRGHLAALSRAVPRDWLSDAAVFAREAAANLVSGASDSPIVAWHGSTHLAGESLTDVSLWQGLAQLFLTMKGEPRKAFDVNSGVPSGAGGQTLKAEGKRLAAVLGEHDEAVRLLDNVRRLPAARYDAEEWAVLMAQLRVLRLAVAELELVFAERRVSDYPRFAWAALQALGTDEAPTDTALALDAELRHLLVDEFQDTSETQVRLMEALTAGWQRGDGRTLFLVGDPMQSIYRFRNAEVGLFMNVRRYGLGQVELEPLTLAVNFRSTTPVIEWVNDCFAQVLPTSDDALRGAASYVPSAPSPNAGNDGGVQVHALLRRSRRYEAEQVALIVRDRLEVAPEARIGILVQGRSHLLQVVAELARAGIAFRATDIDPLGERPAVLDVLALTRAIAHRADRPAWLAVLRAPWCGLTLGALHTLVGDDRHATIAELLADPIRRARLTGADRTRLEASWKVLELALAELRRFGLRDTVERAWNALGGAATLLTERELDEVEAYFDTLAGLESHGAGSVDLGQLARALETLYAQSRERADVRVELLTIHKAKGLQYDTVIVPGLERQTGRDPQRLLQWLKPTQAGGLPVVAPLARSGTEENLLYSWLATLEREKLLEERRRLLYVAATRAERWLHLFGSAQVNEASATPSVRRPPSGTALGMLWPVLQPTFVQRLIELGAIAGESAPELSRRPPLRRTPAGWVRGPWPAAPKISSHPVPRAATDPMVDFDWATETARHVGTVVHRELQSLARDGTEAVTTEALRRLRWRDELAELGVPPALRPAAVERVAAAVERTLANERGRWLLERGRRSSMSEFALTGMVGGELVRAVIDRSFVDEAGIRWIVDYKTSSHEGAGLESFLDNEQERYRPQLEKYASLMQRLGPEPVRLGLYFPLLDAWREWPAARSTDRG